ncbi:integrase core domain-containing protein [Polynucleobacter sp. Nonnen-W13]|uniref:integrase core domain-containing protein n=1 Tax=Polynucleobacter sp. Nonnen-W13 TaxID=1855625 RepID=UPI001C0B86C1|nr:transposase [Polynucleobacter sp. Nonnen-W13]
MECQNIYSIVQGPKFIAKQLSIGYLDLGVKTACIEPRSPWENSFYESFKGFLGDNLLDGKIFYTLKVARIIVRSWVKHYNHVTPHSA